MVHLYNFYAASRAFEIETRAKYIRPSIRKRTVAGPLQLVFQNPQTSREVGAGTSIRGPLLLRVVNLAMGGTLGVLNCGVWS